MAEVTFAKQFLATLDSKPQKLSSDHVADPKKLPAQPAFTLPRISKPYPRPSERSQPTATPESSALLNVTLSPLRKTNDSPAPVSMSVNPKLSIYDLKSKLGPQTGYAVDKLKILWQRKPVTDSKLLHEVVGRDSGDVDLAVMYTGSPTAAPQSAATATQPSVPPTTSVGSTQEKMDVDETPVAQGQSGRALLDGTQFWTDLHDFVLQRVRDEDVTKEAMALFQKAWKSR